MQHDTWQTSGGPEEILEPDLPIIDPHHHYWDKHPSRHFVSRYMIEELAADVNCGHNIVSTVYMQSTTAGWARADGPEGMKPVGESELMQGVAVMGESGLYTKCRVAAGIIGTVDLTLGIPTPPSPLFLGRFAPVLRRFSAVLLCCLASWRQDGENGRKMAKNGRNLGEKRARNRGG